MGRRFLLLPIATLALVACGGDDSASSGDDASVDASLDVVAIDGPTPDASAPDVAAEACVPQCAGRSCGDDGCGGTCGTCAAPKVCGDKGTCVDQCPCFYGQCANCYCATAAEQYAVQHDCAIGNYVGHEGALMTCTGSKTAPATWTAGTPCPNGCVVAPPMMPDYCASAPGTGRHVWIAFDGATAAPMTHTRDFFDCVFQHSNFNQLAGAYSTGRGYAGVGGIAQLATSCRTVHAWWCASVADDAATLQCIEDQTHWQLAPDDIVLYYPATATTSGSNCTCTTCGYSGGCADGRNHWHIPVRLPNQTSVSVEAAFAFTGAGDSCQTALGLHEVYEAAAASDAADCCNGQNSSQGSCKGLEPSPPFGWYSENGCGQPWELQYVSPAGQTWNPSACTKLTFQ